MDRFMLTVLTRAAACSYPIALDDTEALTLRARLQRRCLVTSATVKYDTNGIEQWAKLYDWAVVTRPLIGAYAIARRLITHTFQLRARKKKKKKKKIKKKKKNNSTAAGHRL